MILYSIIPDEVIFGNNDIESKFIELKYMGERVQVFALSNSKFQISRLLSTSPKAYLNPSLQPGTVIDRWIF